MRKLKCIAAVTLPLFALPLDTQAKEWPINSDILTVDQGWDEAARTTFYHAPQGSPIMPYEYFLALEQTDNQNLFMDEAHLRDLGMLYWGASDLNPDKLPIGLTIDKGIYGVEQKLGMNCAACHVTEIKVGDKVALVDGGVSHFDFWSFMQELLSAIQTTHADDTKFNSFAERILGDDLNEEASVQLRARLRGVMRKREDWAIHNTASVLPGPGRVDALNVILNQTTAKMLDRPDNARAVDAPVSFPYLWDAPYLEFVQYNGVVPNKGAGALGRNVGQVLGVFGELAINEHTLPGGYASSVRVDHLNDLEETLRTLTSPSWASFSEKGLLPAVDQTLASKGKSLYDAQCSSCHEVIDTKNRGDLGSIGIPLMALPEIGTDPAAAMGFAARAVASGPLEGRKIGYIAGEPMCEYVHGNSVLAHLTVGVIMHDLGTTYKPLLATIEGSVVAGVRGKIHALGDQAKSFFNGHKSTDKKKENTDQALISLMTAAGATEDEIVNALEARSEKSTALYNLLVEQGLSHHGQDAACLGTLETAQYRARPLNGVWATGPFLHNGSVPTLADLLKSPADRSKAFVVGDSVLDPVSIGFVAADGADGFILDTSESGNLNSGHEYGTQLTDPEKQAILEYMKTL
jgi:hypothetical protein